MPELPHDRQLLFVTDLDGTLLDHETYSWEPAKEALDQLRQLRIPLILASSKTAAEIAPLRAQLGFENCPAIVENGAGVLHACACGTTQGDEYSKLLAEIGNITPKLRNKFTGFSRWSADEIAKLTGLAPLAAELAKQRQFSEPGIWSGNDVDLERFLTEAAERGITAKRGGRFLTLSLGGDKADRMMKIVGDFEAEQGLGFCIALGDAPNDIKMLQAADLGIIVPNPAHDGIVELAGEKTGKIIRAKSFGPCGWNEAVLDVLRGAGRV